MQFNSEILFLETFYPLKVAFRVTRTSENVFKIKQTPLFSLHRKMIRENGPLYEIDRLKYGNGTFLTKIIYFFYLSQIQMILFVLYSNYLYLCCTLHKQIVDAFHWNKPSMRFYTTTCTPLIVLHEQLLYLLSRKHIFYFLKTFWFISFLCTKKKKKFTTKHKKKVQKHNALLLLCFNSAKHR